MAAAAPGTLRFDGRVAIVTGAGGGLGRAYALLLASRGAKVVVNDLGGTLHGGSGSSKAADLVVEEITRAGGVAIADYHSVEQGDAIVKTAVDKWGGVDVLINNAGILRDVSFHKMSEADWDAVYRVHLLGAYVTTRAAWPYMRENGYGRVVLMSSAAGLYGNFGQANYSSMKMALVGLANTLSIEGGRRGILVNAVCPVAGTRMTETVLPADLVAALRPELVAPIVAYLCHESCTDNGCVIECGGGWAGKLRRERSRGVFFDGAQAGSEESYEVEDVAKRWRDVVSFVDADHPESNQDALGIIMEHVEASKERRSKL